jgi:hypothetical protein
MGHQVIKQPNGLLAIYSDGVDAWLRWDMTPKQVEKYYARRAYKEAKQAAHRTVAAVMADNPREAYYQFTMTFAEANAHSRAGQGGDEGPEGPVDEALYQKLNNPPPIDWEDGKRHLLRDSMDNHLIFGAGEDAS